jgi:hypothetical protein
MTVIKEGYDNGAAYAEGAVVVMASDVEEATGEMQHTNPASSTSTKTPSAYVDVSGPKQGHVFCGCCCDVRRATIAINIVNLVFAVISIILLSAAVTATRNFNDDSVQNALEEADLDSAFTASIVITVFTIIFNIAAIVGAARFNIWLVLSNAVWLIVGFIITIAVNIKASNSVSGYNYNFVNVAINLVVTCFFLYPHVVLIYEIKFTKTMSHQTYKREEQSCCCVSTNH